jgi:hypothetical protein
VIAFDMDFSAAHLNVVDQPAQFIFDRRTGLSQKEGTITSQEPLTFAEGKLPALATKAHLYPGRSLGEQAPAARGH